MFTPAVPGAPPSKPPPTKSSLLPGGRKVTQSKNKRSQPPEDKPRKKKGATTMDELDRMLENDHVALLSMKKDIGLAQKAEIDKSVKSLLKLQKEFDTLTIANNLKDKELNDLKDSIIQLKSLKNAANATTGVVKNEGTAMQNSLEKVQSDVEAEHRTHKMLLLISKRLNTEIAESKIETTKTHFELDAVKHDLDACESSLRLSKQELAVQERQVESLTLVNRTRKEDRMKKMKHLKGIVTDGEASAQLMKTQTLTNENAKTVGFNTSNDTSGNGNRNASGNGNVVGFHNGVNKSNTTKSPPRDRNSPASEHINDRGVTLASLMEEFNTDCNPLTATFANFNFGKATSSTTVDGGDISIVAGSEVLTFENIKEIISRYKSHQLRLEKLQLFSSELKSELFRQRGYNKDLSERLEKSAASHEKLSSNRQVYQEVDMKDTALASARKEAEDCLRKEYRLRVNIEALKRGLPRFLTKVTKVIHPIPTVEQLPDAVHKLEDEIAKLIKYIGTAIIKDATPDDLAALTASNTNNKQENKQDKENHSQDVNSEIGRIRKLPGYQRLQRQLFINLMSAKQDITERNVRIYSQLKTNIFESNDNVRPDTVHSHTSGREENEESNEFNSNTSSQENGHVKHSQIPTNFDSLDRSTVKSISRMIVDKNNNMSTIKSSNTLRRQQQYNR